MPDDRFAPLGAAEMAAASPAPKADVWLPVLPVPADAPRTIPPHRLGKPSNRWPYRDRSGALLGLVARFDRDNGKDVMPLTFCRNAATGETAWRWQGFNDPRPLYGLEKLDALPDAGVLVVEGEKAADAAQALFPEYVVVTSPGGSNAAAKADWSALKGRRVVVWPDNDEPGRHYAANVARLVMEAGAVSVAVVDVPTDWPKGWDVADPLPEGVTVADLRRMLDAAAPIDATSPPTMVDGDGWPALVPLDAPNLPRLDRDALPGWAGDFAAALSDATETPVELAASMVLATCSAAAARRFRIMVKPGYFESLNQWLACALPPGNRKSAVQSASTAPLRGWEFDKAELLGDEIKAAASALATAQARAKELRSKAARATDDMDAHDLAAQAAAIEANMPEVPRVPQLWTSEVTPEKLGMILAENDERIAWLSSEGGLFDIMGGRYSNGVPNIDLFLKAHSGDADRVDRVGRAPVLLREPLLTIGLSPQPDVLRGLAGKPGFRGRGLLARFLFLLPPSPLGYRTLAASPVPKRIEQAFAAGVRAILDAPPAVGDDGDERPHILRLSPAAHDEWQAFALHIETTMRPGGEFEHATDWAGKCPGAAARLAGVLHVIETAVTGGWGREISLDTMARALGLMAVIAKHSRHALDLMGADEGIGAARRVWDWIEAGRRPRFTVRDAFNALRGTFSRVADVTAALDVLVERGYVEVIESPTRGPGRPSSPMVVVRPDIAGGWL